MTCFILGSLVFSVFLLHIKRQEIIAKIITKSPILTAVNEPQANVNISFDSLDCGVFNCENIDENSCEMQNLMEGLNSGAVIIDDNMIFEPSVNVTQVHLINMQLKETFRNTLNTKFKQTIDFPVLSLINHSGQEYSDEKYTIRDIVRQMQSSDESSIYIKINSTVEEIDGSVTPRNFNYQTLRGNPLSQ